MPGIDIEKDILNSSTARIIVPKHIQTVSADIVTGKDFRLCWP
jgi:acyl CoA:acetate/3-ketoacid CoA transferase